MQDYKFPVLYDKLSQLRQCNVQCICVSCHCVQTVTCRRSFVVTADIVFQRTLLVTVTYNVKTPATNVPAAQVLSLSTPLYNYLH